MLLDNSNCLHVLIRLQLKITFAVLRCSLSMSRESNINTTRQEFLKESFSKEAKLRNRWFQGYFGANTLPAHLQSERAGSPGLNTKKKPSVTLIKIRPAPPTPPIKLSQIDEIPAMIESGEKFKEMRSPSPGTKGIIFSGLSCEGNGRKAYLRKRNKKPPELKFEYPQTSALEVGWQIAALSKEQVDQPAFYGKGRIVSDTFFRSNGVL